MLESAIDGRYVIGFLLLLLAGKIIATSLTIGIGGSGGVFAPSLFMGAMLGTAFGIALHHIAPGLAPDPGAYGLVGMGAVFAGAARTPITAVVIMFELTGEYSIVLPLMLAIVLATVVSRVLTRDTIYTLKLRRRGINLDAPDTRGPFAGRTVRTIMEAAPDPLPQDTPLRQAARTLTLAGHGVLPVIDASGSYRGVITARAVAEALGGDEDPPATINNLTELPARITADAPLADTLHLLIDAPGTGLPVLDDTGTVLVGWITHQAVLGALPNARTAASGRGAPDTEAA